MGLDPHRCSCALSVNSVRLSHLHRRLRSGTAMQNIWAQAADHSSTSPRTEELLSTYSSITLRL